MGSRRTGGGVDNVYAAAEKWVDCALRSDDSLFTPGTPIWTRQRLGELRERFLDHHDEWKGSGFFEKLESILSGSPAEVIQLMAEAVYVTYLIVWKGAIGRSAKQRRINQVLGWSPEPVTIPDDLANGLELGIANPGAFFIANFAIHPGFIIEFVEHWKTRESDERISLLTKPWGFKSAVMNVPLQASVLRDNPLSPVAQRMALLHLVFPDTFEGIVTPNHKFRIARSNWFSKYITKPDDDVDREVQQVRNGLEVERGGRDFDFYDQDIYSRWNSDPNPWDVFVRDAQAYIDTGQLEREEIGYKLEISRQLAAARDAVVSGANNWSNLLKIGLASRPGHPLSWQAAGTFESWLNRSPGDAIHALQAIWTPSDSSATERICAFSDIVPRSVVSRPGTFTTLASVLLMGLDVEKYPPFRVTLLDNAYERTGYGKPNPVASEATLYEHALGFLDRFIEVADKHGLGLRHRLDAQSIVWKFVNELPPLPEDGPPPPNGLDALADELTLPLKFPGGDRHTSQRQEAGHLPRPTRDRQDIRCAGAGEAPRWFRRSGYARAVPPVLLLRGLRAGLPTRAGGRTARIRAAEAA